MIFWLLIALAAAPLIMGAMLLFMLRRGVHHRLHERRMAQQDPNQPYGPDVVASGWSTSDASFSGGGGDFGGGGATGSWESGGGDFGGGGASGDWGSSDAGGGDSGGGDSGGGDSGGGGGD